MKLDSAPISLSSRFQTELKHSTESDLTTAIIEPLQPIVVDSQKKQKSATAIFGTTFITIFLAEIGDKTQLSTLLMSAESHSPWVVFLGSAVALVTTSFLGVLLGSWIANRLSPKIVEKSAGVMLLLIAVMLFWDVVSS
ncbi:TMEM165/GDT1 family protein [Halotia branconii]|uniref:GDT1 family protein n=1 Tax=Halotia branconii CENA392 TaxID=1539056 RepID=A0AAJ6NXJ4_9CYAN|nr:TMEM165/GDT1 family protein [Halotia branconii]WGV28326.1 TMEM165/GDT1 family protein [Halotia branconii CENA392]